MCKPALYRFPTRQRRLTTVFPTAVPLLSRPINMRPSTGREMETSLPSRLPFRCVTLGLFTPLYHTLTRATHTGPCQPSMVYRYLRTLEGVSPPLSLMHLSCQTTAKAFISARTSRPLPVFCPLLTLPPPLCPLDRRCRLRRHLLHCQLDPICTVPSLRPHVLPGRAWQRDRHCPTRRARRRSRGHGTPRAPPPLPLLFVARAQRARQALPRAVVRPDV